MQAAATRLTTPIEEIAEFCRRWKVRELALFGSVLRDDFGPQSDIDLLVEFDRHHTLDMLIEMKAELQQLLGHDVDLIVKKTIENDPNYLRRKMILDSAQAIYASPR